MVISAEISSLGRLDVTRSSAKKKKALAQCSSRPLDLARKASESFFEKYFDPKSELKKQHKCMKKHSDGIDWKRIKKNETLHAFSLFDLVD